MDVYKQSNTLCNSIDGVTNAARKQTNRVDHTANIAIGKLGQAFKLVCEARELLGQAEKALDGRVDMDKHEAEMQQWKKDNNVR